jgi:hypothetical protein
MISFFNNWEWFTYGTHYSLKYVLTHDAKGTQYSLNTPDQFELPFLHHSGETERRWARDPMMRIRYTSGGGTRFEPARWDWDRRDATYNIINLPVHFSIYQPLQLHRPVKLPALHQPGETGREGTPHITLPIIIHEFLPKSQITSKLLNLPTAILPHQSESTLLREQTPYNQHYFLQL